MAFQNKLDTQYIGILFRTDQCQRAGGQELTVLLNRFQSEKAGSPGVVPFQRASFADSRHCSSAISTVPIVWSSESITYALIHGDLKSLFSGEWKEAQRVSPNLEKIVVSKMCPFLCFFLSFYVLRQNLIM